MQHIVSSSNTSTLIRVGMRDLRRDKWGLLGLCILLSFVVIALLVPYVSVDDPWEQSTTDIIAPPSWNHPFGADIYGRDVFSRVLWGTRVSLGLGVLAALTSFLVGTVLGSFGGYYGGFLDDVITRFIDLFIIIPRVILLILVAALMGTEVWYMALFIGLTMWASTARIARAQVITFKERGFVKAAALLGAGDIRLLFLHILPNGIFPAISNTMLQVGDAILIEAGLSFFGLGDTNVASWGQIINMGMLSISSWWLVVFPGAAVALTVLAFNLLGDSLERRLKPRLR